VPSSARLEGSGVTAVSGEKLIDGS
jgi:hypothetical protein